MNPNIPVRRPASILVAVLVGFMFLGLGLVLARDSGVIALEDERRALGLLVGVVMLVTGNLLPKLRPLRSSAALPGRIHAAERLAGWALVLAGLAYASLFVLLPLNRAAPASSLVGILAIAIIALRCLPLAWALFFERRSTGDVAGRRIASDQRLAIWMLFAFFFVLGSACVTFLVDDVPRRHEIGAWMLIVYAFASAGLQLLLEPRR